MVFSGPWDWDFDPLGRHLPVCIKQPCLVDMVELMKEVLVYTGLETGLAIVSAVDELS